MSACAGMEELLAERASGPIAAEDEARVAEHLAGCARCRTVAEEHERLFGALALGEDAGRLRPGLAEATLRAWKQRHRRRVVGLALGAGFGAAAAAAALVLAPAFFAARAPRAEPAAALASWDPEVDAALYASGTEEASSSSDDEVTAEDAALAAFDEAAAL